MKNNHKYRALEREALTNRQRRMKKVNETSVRKNYSLLVYVIKT